MLDADSAALSKQLCPWLDGPLSTLESALAGARLGHAWLIAGPRGVGKLNLSLVFADRLLRGTAGSPPSPLEIGAAVESMRIRHTAADHHPDLHWVHPEEQKRSISVEQIRVLLDSLALKGFMGGPKVVVIEPAETMTGGAANALLKALEEPRTGTYLLLVSHQPGRLPSTIRSRCQTLLVRGPAAEVQESDDAELRMRSRAERAPLLAAYFAPRDDNIINELEDAINQIYEFKRDPQSVADEWRKADLDANLAWLIGRVRQTIRLRIVRRGSNPITEPPGPVLHNPWSALRLGALLELLASAERLRDQLGGGVNAELALTVLLLGFQPERGGT
jgi:DNA polymerase-3 subunit delta'